MGLRFQELDKCNFVSGKEENKNVLLEYLVYSFWWNLVFSIENLKLGRITLY